MEDMSFQVSLENCPDGGGIIPPARNVNENVLVILSLSVMLHKATLTSRSQTSGGDVDS